MPWALHRDVLSAEMRRGTVVGWDGRSSIWSNRRLDHNSCPRRWCMLHPLWETPGVYLTTPPRKIEEVPKLKVKGSIKRIRSETLKGIAMSSHLLIVPVTVIFVRFSNSCDLEHRAGLLLSGQAVQYVHYYVCLPSPNGDL